MQARMETASERYRRIKANNLKGSELHDFTSPSGMQWKLRRPDIIQFMANGVMPIDMASRLADVDDPKELEKVMDVNDILKSLEFMRKVVQYVTVEPHIVETAQTPNEISAEEVELEDVQAIFAWAMPGGGKARSLDTFHQE